MPNPSELAAYVPAWLLRSLAADPSRPRSGGSSEAAGAVLFIDLSGFCTLADRLEREARTGPERLCEIVGQCFDALVGLVLDHDGDVLRFAGDALVAFFPTQDAGGMPNAVQRAAACAMAAHRAAARLDPGIDFRVRLRAGVDAGVVNLADVGGERGRWDFLASGKPILEAAQAQMHAGVGETCIAAGAQPFLGGHVQAEPGPHGLMRLKRAEAAHLPPADPLASPTDPPASPAESQALSSESPAMRSQPLSLPSEAAIRAYLPEVVLRRSDAGHGQWLAEYREASALFVNLVDPAFGTIEGTGELQRAVRAIQAAVFALDGSANLVVVDDKGVVILVAFGLPLMSREDDAVRAVLAARDVHAALKELGVRHGIGLTRGRVFCGLSGSDKRRQYVILGHVVNVAARLMKAAGGGVLCDATTARAAGGRAQFEALPAMPLKGIAAPVPVFRLLDPEPENGVEVATRPTLIARRAESEKIAALVNDLSQHGRGALLLIEGEPGIGKSVLVQHALREARAAGVTAVFGAANAVEQASAYGPWQGVLARLLGLDALADPAARASRVQKNLRSRPERAAWAPLLNPILPVEIPETDAVRQMPAALRGVNTRELVAQVLQEAAEDQPLVIALDDAQWMDASSWELAAFLVQRMPKLLMVLAARPMGDAAPTVWHELRAAKGTVHLQLGRMPRADVAAMVCQRLRVRTMPPELEALVCTRAEGHPFYAKELVQALRETGRLAVEGGTCRLAPITGADELALPGTIQGILNSRLDLLTPPQQLAVKVASVIGRVFRFEDLEAALPVASDRPHLREDVDSLATLGLVHIESPPPDLAHSFEHILIQEAAYNLLPVTQRRKLHRSVAVQFEARLASEPALLPSVAHHWRMADEPAKAIQFLDRAGTVSLARGANAEAVAYLEQARQLAGKVAGAEQVAGAGQVPDIQRVLHLADAYLRLGQLDRSRELSEDALARLGRPRLAGRLGASRIAGALARQLRNLLLGGRSHPAADPDERTRRILAAEAATLGMEHVYYAGDMPGSIYLSLLAVNEAEAADSFGSASEAYQFLASVAVILRLDRLAARYFNRARQTEDAGNLAQADTAEGAVNAAFGRWEVAERLLRRGWTLAASMNDTTAQGKAAEAFGLIDEVRNPPAALALRQSQIHLARACSNELHETWGLLGVAAALLARGDRDAAARRLAELEAHLPRDEASLHVRYQALLAATHSVERHPTQAAREADLALAQIRASPPRGPTDLAALSALAETCVRLLEVAAPPHAAATMRARSACQALGSYARIYPAGQPRSLRMQARLAQAEGNSRRAQQLLRRALAAARRLDASHDEAEALTSLALGMEPGPEREAQLAEAEVIRLRLAAEPGLTLAADSRSTPSNTIP